MRTLHLSASVALTSTPARTTHLVEWAAFPLAALVAVASLGGILSPAIYAAETANWRAQALGQDWIDLVLAVPWLIVAGVAARHGARRARLVLGGAYAFTAYTFAIYAFAVRFNALFLVYCAALGVSVFALAALLGALLREDAARWYDDAAPRRLAGALLIGPAIAFALLWLAAVVPALLRGGRPDGLDATGLLTNPVHVIDLSLALPAMLLAGLGMWRGRPFGLAVAPVLLGFSVLMAASVGGLIVAMYWLGEADSPAVAGVMAALSLGGAAALIALLRHTRDG